MAVVFFPPPHPRGQPSPSSLLRLPLPLPPPPSPTGSPTLRSSAPSTRQDPFSAALLPPHSHLLPPSRSQCLDALANIILIGQSREVQSSHRCLATFHTRFDLVLYTQLQVILVASRHTRQTYIIKVCSVGPRLCIASFLYSDTYIHVHVRTIQV